MTNYATGWGPDAPTPAQIKEFFDQIISGRVTRQRMQNFLNQKDIPQPYLRHLETVTLAPTQGNVTLAQAENVFTGWIDDDFKEWGTNIPGKDTDEAMVDVYEMIRNGTFKTLFESLGAPRNLCLTQGQIVEFCRNHRNLLRQEGYGTFFLFEVNGNLFVARVGVGDGRLRARAYRLGYDRVWGADGHHRLVVKQQTI